LILPTDSNSSKAQLRSPNPLATVSLSHRFRQPSEQQAISVLSENEKGHNSTTISETTDDSLARKRAEEGFEHRSTTGETTYARCVQRERRAGEEIEYQEEDDDEADEMGTLSYDLCLRLKPKKDRGDEDEDEDSEGTDMRDESLVDPLIY